MSFRHFNKFSVTPINMCLLLLLCCNLVGDFHIFYFGYKFKFLMHFSLERPEFFIAARSLYFQHTMQLRSAVNKSRINRIMTSTVCKSNIIIASMSEKLKYMKMKIYKYSKHLITNHEAAK